METTRKDNQGQRGQKKTIRLLIILLVLVLIGATALVVYLYRHRDDGRPTYETEVAAKLGQLEGKTVAEIQAELNRVIEEGMFHVAINADPAFANGSAEGNLEIENVPNNLYLMRLEIYRQDTGELIYSTKFIEPNSHIQRAALDTALEKGDYPCTAVFHAYQPGTLTEMGQVPVRITVHVLN